jgi:hypothetical protein
MAGPVGNIQSLDRNCQSKVLIGTILCLTNTEEVLWWAIKQQSILTPIGNDQDTLTAHPCQIRLVCQYRLLPQQVEGEAADGTRQTTSIQPE